MPAADRGRPLYRLISVNAPIPATRIGRAMYTRADLIERWLTARTQRSRRQTHDQRDGLTTTDTSTAA